MAEETTRLASIQLASAPEETTSSFAGLAEETTRLASIQLASVPEETTSSFAGLAAPYPPPQSYCESIRSVVGLEWCTRSTLSSESSQSGSNYSSISGASSSYLSSGCSSGSASADAADFGAEELTKIAHRMVSDGYTQRMVQAFKYGGEQEQALEALFADIDINWVFQIRKIPSSWKCEYELPDKSLSPCLQELVERWIRALTIIIVSMKELVAAVHEMLAVARFGKASISAMLIFVDSILSVSNAEKLPAMLHMYICISNASYDMLTMHVISSDAKRIFKEIAGLLERKGNMLIGSMSKTMRYVKDTLMKDRDMPGYWRQGRWVVGTTDDDWWAIEITRGGGEVHKNIRLMVDYIVLMRKAHVSAKNSKQSHNTARLSDLIRDRMDYLKDLLLRKSGLCSDLSLRYLFLLNNSYFVSQVSEPSISLAFELLSGHHGGLELTPECTNYMDSYIKVSWEDVMSCLSSLNFHGPIRRWINTSPLVKFHLAFHKTYLAQKFWKVPDPRLRDALRRAITERVISAYRNYLKENPELEKQISSGSDSPEILEEMLRELFEG